MSAPAQTVTVRVPFTVRKRGGRKLAIEADGSSLAPPRPRVDSTLLKALARAHRWNRLLENGRYGYGSELASAEKINPSYVSRILRLTLLAPDIVEATVEGRQADGIEAAALLMRFPRNWHEQRARLYQKEGNRLKRRSVRLLPGPFSDSSLIYWHPSAAPSVPDAC